MRLIRKTIALLFLLTLMAGVSEAATLETVHNGEALTRMQRLAIAYPDYFQSLEKEPTVNEFINVLYEASKVSKSNIISYEEIATKIKQGTGIDIKVLPKNDARRIFKEHVYKYADGYLSVTLANNSRLNMFCEVYVPNTNELAYVLRVEGSKSDDSKNAKTYKTMAEEFYRAFDKAVQTEIKKKDKD